MLFFITGCTTNDMENNSKVKNKMISVEEVNAIINDYDNVKDTFIIDVREQGEYVEGHLNNSINIPVGSISTIGDAEGITKNSKIIVYCRSGNRSSTAKENLESMGYTNVYDMGGILNWPYDIVGE